MKAHNRPHLVYIIPNLFTAASAFMGVISVIASSKGEFEKAVYLILLSLLFDGLDGRVARLTKTTSKFGAEFDSLADLVAFGVAPAMLFYFSIGFEYGRLGSLLSAIYVLFGAIRLARFNVTSPTSEPSVFIGVPIPTAAVFMSSWILLSIRYSFFQGSLSYILLFFMGLVSILMVSNIRYPSFKKIDLHKANLKKVLILLIILFSFIYLFFIESMVSFFTLYILYGLIRGYKNFIKRKKIVK